MLIIIISATIHFLVHRIRLMAQLRAEVDYGAPVVWCEGLMISAAFFSQTPINYTEILLTVDISLSPSR